MTTNVTIQSSTSSHQNVKVTLEHLDEDGNVIRTYDQGHLKPGDSHTHHVWEGVRLVLTETKGG